MLLEESVCLAHSRCRILLVGVNRSLQRAPSSLQHFPLPGQYWEVWSWVLFFARVLAANSSLFRPFFCPSASWGRVIKKALSQEELCLLQVPRAECPAPMLSKAALVGFKTTPQPCRLRTWPPSPLSLETQGPWLVRVSAGNS